MQIPRHWRLKAQRYCLKGELPASWAAHLSASPGLASLQPSTGSDQRLRALRICDIARSTGIVPYARQLLIDKSILVSRVGNRYSRILLP
jgi:hypothetical protein